MAFSSTDYTWSYFRYVITYGGDAVNLAEAGMYQDANNNLVLPNGVQNVYGLPINSTLVNPAADTFDTLLHGTDLPASDYYGWGWGPEFFVEVPTPNLQTVGYYFATETPYLNYGPNAYPVSNTNYPVPPLPGSPTFSASSTSPMMIGSVGQEITVSGWAKQQIGNSGKYAFLEQYFTNALMIDTNGNVTTTSAGIVSPYGEFFPTVPGRCSGDDAGHR